MPDKGGFSLICDNLRNLRMKKVSINTRLTAEDNIHETI